MARRRRVRERRRRRSGQPGTFDGIPDEAIYFRDGWTCQMPVCICPAGRHIDPELRNPDPWAASIDHITRLADGGTDSRDNKRTAHAKCNERDAAREDRRRRREAARAAIETGGC